MMSDMEAEKKDSHDRNMNDLIEIVVSIKDNMVTKTEFAELEKKVDEGFKSVGTQFEQVNGKIDGIHRRIDAELEQRKLLEDRVSKVEAEVFPV